MDNSGVWHSKCLNLSEPILEGISAMGYVDGISCLIVNQETGKLLMLASPQIK